MEVDTENAALCTNFLLDDVVFVRCFTKNCSGENDPNHHLYFYPIWSPDYSPDVQKVTGMDTLQVLCFKAIASYFTRLFRWLYHMEIKKTEKKKLLTLIFKHLKKLTQRIPPQMANSFTRMVMNALSRHSAFMKEEYQMELHKKFLLLALHPSITSLHLPRMSVVFEEYIYNKLFGKVLTKIEVLQLETYLLSSLQRLKRMPQLHTIIFHGCSGFFLEVLWRSCGQQLRKLDIAFSGHLNECSIHSLNKFQHLEELNIIRTNIMGLALEALLPPSLQKISCSCLCIGQLNKLAKGVFPNLREIYVDGWISREDVPIDKHIGNLRILKLQYTAVTENLLSTVGETLTELHLIQGRDLDARILICQCPNLHHFEVHRCRHVVRTYEGTLIKGPMKTGFNLLRRLHMITLYLLADMIFIQFGKYIQHLTVIAKLFEEEEEMNKFLKVLTSVPQNLRTISFRTDSKIGLLSADIVQQLMLLCPRLEVVEGVASREEACRLQKINPSIKFIT